MPIPKENKTLRAVIRNRCKDRLGKSVDDAAIDFAIKHQTVQQSAEWNKIVNALAQANIDPHEPISNITTVLRPVLGNVEKFVTDIVSKVNEDLKTPVKERSTADRLLKDYFLPTLAESQTASANLLETVNAKLKLAPTIRELISYKSVLTADLALLGAVSNLTFALDNVLVNLRENIGKNYTPTQNALIISSILDTVQKSQQGGHWRVQKLLATVRLVSQVTLPDLPLDSLTLESIKDLLTYVNEVIDTSRALEGQKSVLFSNDNPKQVIARKALMSAMGVECASLGQICASTLRKPMTDAMKAVGDLGSHARKIETEDGLDYLHTLNTLDQLGNVVNGAPLGLLPKSLQPYADYYVTAMKAAGQVTSVVGDIAIGTGQVLGEIGAEVGTHALGMVSDDVKGKADGMITKTGQVAKTVAPTLGKILSAISYITPYHYTPYVPKQTAISVGGRILGAAGYFVPSYIKNKFTTPYPQTAFWQSLKAPVGSLNSNLAEAFFYFNDIQTASNSPALEEEFFNAIMKKNTITATYHEYLDFKGKLDVDCLSRSLDTQLAFFGAARSEDKFDITLYMVQKVKTLENNAKQYNPAVMLTDPAEILSEFQAALSSSSEDVQVKEFQKLYVRPAFDRSLLHYEQQHFMPQLEKALDAGHEDLREIYSKLKAGQFLTGRDLSTLKNFSGTGVTFTVNEKIETLVQAFPPAPMDAPAKGKTPKEASRDAIQSTWNGIHPVCQHISERLEKQLTSVRGLSALSPNDPLKTLCDSKIRYLEKLQSGLNNLMRDIKSEDHELAERIRGITSGEIAADIYAASTAGAIVSTVMGLGISMLTTTGMEDATKTEKILAYALSSSAYMDGVVEAKHRFETTVDKTPPPAELMMQLGNPLTIATLDEDVVRKAVAGAIDKTRTGLVQPLATYYVMKTALAYAYSSALLADIAVGILVRPSVKEQISNFLGIGDMLQTVSDDVSEAISPYQDKLTETVKDAVCSMLNIEVAKELERRAHKYTETAPESRAALAKGERDAFSGFYLQYRGIKKENPELDVKAGVEYLFPSFATKSPDVKEKMVGELVNEFKRLDKVFNADERIDKALKTKEEPTQKSELENEMQFLMGIIDFDSPDENALVGMTIYNRLVMMQLEAAKQLNPAEATKLHQKAVGALETVLKNIEKADTKNPDEVRVHERASQFAPATKLASQVKFDALQKEMTDAIGLVRRHIKDRDLQIELDERPGELKRLGRTIIATDIDMQSRTIVYAKINRGLRAVLPTVGVLVVAALAIASGVGAIVATAGLAAVAVGAVAILGSVIFNTVRQVRLHSDEFKAIDESKDSNINKGFKRFGLGLKCFFLGVRDALVDIDVFRSYPTKETLDGEKKVLSELEVKLEKVKDLVLEQIKDKEAVDYDPKKPDPSKFYLQGTYEEHLARYKKMLERGEKIEAMTKEISQSLEQTESSLAKSSAGDARWQRGVNSELESFQGAFGKMKESMVQVNIIKHVESKMQPEMTVQEKTVNRHANKAEANLQRAMKLTETFKAKKEQIIKAMNSKQNPEHVGEMIVALKEVGATIKEANEDAGREFELAKKETNKSGEVGYFSYLTSLTSITGPTTIACTRAEKAWIATKELDTNAQEVIKTVEDKSKNEAEATDDMHHEYDEDLAHALKGL